MIISAYQNNMQPNDLKAGDIVYAASAKAGRNGNYILNINGRNVEAASKDLLFGSGLKLMVVKTSPLEVELLKQHNINLLNTGDKVSAKISPGTFISVNIHGARDTPITENTIPITMDIVSAVRTDLPSSSLFLEP